MKRVLSTHLFIGQRLTVATLNRIHQAGIPAVEIFCARQHFDYRNKSQVAEFGHWFKDSGLALHSIHLPMYNDEYSGMSGPQAVLCITEISKPKRTAMVDELKRALEVTEIIPCRFAVQHLGVSGEEFSEYKLDAAFTALEELTLFARARGAEILLENIPNSLSSGERLQFFLSFTHLDMGFVLDTGHAHLMEGVANAFDVMKDRIRSTHVHDNDGKTDSHLFPLLQKEGTIDWRAAMKLLRSRGDQFPLLLELKHQAEMENPLEQAVEVFDRLEDLRTDD